MSMYLLNLARRGAGEPPLVGSPRPALRARVEPHAPANSDLTMVDDERAAFHDTEALEYAVENNVAPRETSGRRMERPVPAGAPVAAPVKTAPPPAPNAVAQRAPLLGAERAPVAAGPIATFTPLSSSPDRTADPQPRPALADDASLHAVHYASDVPLRDAIRPVRDEVVESSVAMPRLTPEPSPALAVPVATTPSERAVANAVPISSRSFTTPSDEDSPTPSVSLARASTLTTPLVLPLPSVLGKGAVPARLTPDASIALTQVPVVASALRPRRDHVREVLLEAAPPARGVVPATTVGDNRGTSVEVHIGTVEITSDVVSPAPAAPNIARQTPSQSLRGFDGFASLRRYAPWTR